ncbi:MAG: cytochrome c biogenesis protein [Dehalococcoidales bacterium]|nr:cytochrome c biogenesis protein [Dehalococcoidales bacterium]
MGLLFTSLVLITGPIWAKAAWGVSWKWDARLTTTLILWFIYPGYLMVRAYAMEEEREARFAAVVGIVSFINVPIVFLATTLWRTQHPGPTIFQEGLTFTMLVTLLVCLVAFTLLYAYLLRRMISLKQIRSEIRRLKQHIIEEKYLGGQIVVSIRSF